METKKQVCLYCSIAFSTHEERVQFEGKEFHPDCDKKRRRQARLREFFRSLETASITIRPKHHFGR